MNRYLTKFALAAVMITAGSAFAAAQVWDKKTIVTLDESVQLPTMLLQPGTYVVKLANDDANRHIVQFYDKGEQHLVTTVLAIPNRRVRPTGKSVFAFWEVPAGQPKALRAWFYPGDDFGQEFAYPKDEAARITSNNQGETVPLSDDSKDVRAPSR